MSPTSINEKLQGIMQSNALDELPLKYLPPVSDEPSNYYFISYSHSDYKSVYPDIFALQAQGVNIWYDRAMPAGRNWKETAEKYIQPSRCAGVVFYVSENSLLSPAIHEEIAFAQKCGKSCLTINLPLSDGKTYSAKEMLDHLIAEGVAVSHDKYGFISQAFGKDVIYLPYSSSAEQKAEKILSLKKPPLLEFEYDEESGSVSVIAIKDVEIREIGISDFIYTDSNGEAISADRICRCAFANCLRLKRVNLPSSVKILEQYAFCGCNSLEVINLEDIQIVGSYAFAGCESLHYIGTFKDDHLLLCEGSFSECYSLKKIELPAGLDDIGALGFSESGLEEIAIPFSVEIIGASAFGDCENLKKVVIGDGTKQICQYAFGGCCSLEELHIGEEVKNIEEGAFVQCSTGLKKITVSPNNKYFCADGNCLIDRTSKKVILGCASSEIPNDGSVVAIGECAFCNCEKLQKIIIPDSVTCVESHAFEYCANATDVYIGEGKKKICDGAFYNCTSLSSVHIKNLSDWCFIDFDVNANPLRLAHNLYINNKLAENLQIKDMYIVKCHCFDGCESLKTLRLENVSCVDDFAFENCPSLTEIILPETIKFINRSSLQNSDKIRYTEYDNGLYLGDEQNPYLVLIKTKSQKTKSCAIHPQTKLIAGGAFICNEELETVIIPEGVKSIGDMAFLGCAKLKVELPQSLITVGNFAFGRCYSMESINLGSNITYLGRGAFNQSVVKINYNGTAAQWNSITKEGKWYSTNDLLMFIVCTDGTIQR